MTQKTFPASQVQHDGHLDASGERDITSVGPFPASAVRIFLNDAVRMRSIHSVHEGVKTLGLEQCYSLRDLPPLPKSIESLYGTCCWSLTQVQDLDQHTNLRYFGMSGSALAVIPKLPASLKDLSMGNCKNLKKLVDLPQGLEVLDLRYSPWLTELPALPPGLRKLFVRGCKNLKSLPALPATLEWIDVGDCPLIGTVTAPAGCTVYRG